MHPSINFSPFPLLITKRLVLRELKINDRNEILLLRSNDSVNEFLDRPVAITLADAESFISKIKKSIAENKSIYWAINLKEDDTLIGTISLWNISIEKNMAELGYELHPDWQGRGIMQEAIIKVTDYGFNKMKLKIITALIHPENIKSIKLLEKNNFLPDKNFEHVEKENVEKELVYYLKNSSK